MSEPPRTKSTPSRSTASSPSLSSPYLPSGSRAPSGEKDPHGRYLWTLCLGALGIVYGDIGTSPLYALRECFNGAHGVAVTPDNVLGILSLIFWALSILISVKYLSYVMRADNRGEGGILSLTALITSQKRSTGRLRGAAILVGLFGAALLYGEGIITPAISVLSAIEGLEVAAPALTRFVQPITIAILVLLFMLQRRGTASVGAIFGPVTLVWFSTLFALGVWHVVAVPEVLMAINPVYAVRFLLDNQLQGFFALGAVFLVVTGGEALYMDMGHFGRKPIWLTWFALVFPALLANYFGQGALLLTNPAAAESPFYRMAPTWALYPLIVLSTCATVIASQAVISGAFSLTRQATMLGYWPRLQIQHTSANEIGQIYVPGINWFLMVATIGLVLGFGTSSNLAAAYGIAASTTMVLTSLLAFLVAWRRWGFNVFVALGITVAFLIFDLAFFGANIVKVGQGGWFPLTVAACLFLLMTTWKKGRAILGRRVVSQIAPLEDFFEILRIERPARVPGTAVFMSSNPEGTPTALLQNFRHNRVLHETVILLTIVTEDVARVLPEERVHVERLREGFYRITARYGYMETPDIPELLARDDTPTPPVAHTTFFLGRETLLAQGRYGMMPWRERLFAFMARNSQRPTEFFNIPPDRVIEIGSQIEI